MNVLKTYYNQFQRDFSLFLKCRAEELVERGRMILIFLGRKSDHQYSKECCYIWELLAIALNDMVLEVHITYQSWVNFNLIS
jgi:jasmonate O-methyltransferase